MQSNTTLHTLNSQLFQQLSILKEQRFNGELQISSPRGIIWKLYFCLGRLFWVDGGEGDRKSWQRHLKQYFCELDRESLAALEQNSCGCDRQLMLAAYLEKKLINLQQVKEFIQTKVEEIFFDLLQQETYHSLEYNTNSLDCNSEKISCMVAKPLTLINPEATFKDSKLAWDKWIAKGLGFWSPHSLVAITDSRVTLVNISRELLELLNGKNTLRDLAFLTQDNLVELAGYLLIYVHQGLLQFIESGAVDEEALAKQNQQMLSIDNNISLNSNTDRKLPLIVAVNNNREVCQFLEKIVKEIGCRFISIEDSWQAVPRLVAYQPDAILLAGNMPVVNGYQILAQLRRVPHLKNTPIIVLADSIVDRLRAKLLGIVTVNLDRPEDCILLLKIIKKLFSESSVRNSSRFITKYRGVVYKRASKKFKLSGVKFYRRNKIKKYRGVVYSNNINNSHNRDIDSESDLFAKQYATVVYQSESW